MKRSTLVVAAYLLHLVVPTLLLLDILTAALEGEIARTPVSAQGAVAGLAALWLFGGLAFLLFTRDRQAFVRWISAPLAGIYAVYLLFGVGEGIARLQGLTPPIPFLQTGVVRAVSERDPAVYPGISGTKHFTINSLGLRGPLPPKQGRAYRIITVGSSTTICADLDDSETWPYLLMKYMNTSQQSVPVWVGNAGGTGLNTVNHIVLMQWLPGVIPVDLVVFKFGINDLNESLAVYGAPREAVLEQNAQYQGSLPAGVRWRSKYPRYRRLVLPPLIQLAFRDLRQRIQPPTVLQGDDPVSRRRLRASLPIVPLPDLTAGLKEYRARIITLAGECRGLHMRCLFLTETTMWRNDLTPAEQRLLWLGSVGPFNKPTSYLSAADLARAMDMYNRMLLDVCAQSGLECIDTASFMPHDSSPYADDVHLNEQGARLMARNLEQYLLSKPPFPGTTEPSSKITTIGGPTRRSD